MRWSEVFRRLRSAPGVYKVADGYEADVIGAASGMGVPKVRDGSMYGNYTAVLPLADGVVLLLDAYGVPMGERLPSGVRVIGPLAIRLLCRALDLEPPRRMSGEATRPDDAELDRALARQLSLPAERQEEFAREYLGVSDSRSLTAAVERLGQRPLIDEQGISSPDVGSAGPRPGRASAAGNA